MGYNQQQLKVVATTSNHGGDRQQMHESMWEELADRIRLIVNEHRYKDIIAEVYE